VKNTSQSIAVDTALFSKSSHFQIIEILINLRFIRDLGKKDSKTTVSYIFPFAFLPIKQDYSGE